MEKRKIINKVNKDKAEQILQEKSLFSKKRAEKLELKWVDFYMVEIMVDPKMSEAKPDFVLVDGLTGAFTFFNNFEKNEAESTAETGDLKIAPDQAIEIAKREYTFHLLQRNLRTKLHAEIKSIAVKEIVAYPFWIGYFVHSNHYTLKIIDAVNGRFQSGNLKTTIIEHLMGDMITNHIDDIRPLSRGTVHSSNK